VLKKPRFLKDLPTQEQEVCDFLSNLQVVFSFAKLIKNEYNPSDLKAYICIPFPSLLLALPVCVYLNPYMLLFSCRHGARCLKKETPGYCGHYEENCPRPFCEG